MLELNKFTILFLRNSEPTKNKTQKTDTKHDLSPNPDTAVRAKSVNPEGLPCPLCIHHLPSAALHTPWRLLFAIGCPDPHLEKSGKRGSQSAVLRAMG